MNTDGASKYSTLDGKQKAKREGDVLLSSTKAREYHCGRMSSSVCITRFSKPPVLRAARLVHNFLDQSFICRGRGIKVTVKIQSNSIIRLAVIMQGERKLQKHSGDKSLTLHLESDYHLINYTRASGNVGLNGPLND
ncbi:hypothetical protein J6590_032124 [Homalodisca vitripennis]|nr:hypothetical protein J6590_032124 [Homalodisca vitripennis]